MTTAGRFRDLAGQDAYKILGISVAATRKEISRARRERQRTAHPDQGVTGDDASKLINTAASVLLDESLRREYDLWRRGAQQQVWETADRGRSAPPPRRPPATPFPSASPFHSASPLHPAAPFHPAGFSHPAGQPDPADGPDPAAEPFVAERLAGEDDGGVRTVLLVIAVCAVVLCLVLWAVSRLLP
jgi:curved DNA-binding protein CbpA